MERSPDEIIASLEKPGAGIAWYYQRFNHLLVTPLVANRASWAQSRRRLPALHQAVRRAVSGLNEAGCRQRVLVPRLLGLEDSSRYWSVAMTVRHLHIVSPFMAQVVVRLSHREDIAERVDFAAVKPEVERNATDAIAAYLDFADGVLDELEVKVGDRDSKTTLPHPWYGPLTARGWFWLLATHTLVHLRQVRAIRGRL
jgi:hypothetical protein